MELLSKKKTSNNGVVETYKDNDTNEAVIIVEGEEKFRCKNKRAILQEKFYPFLKKLEAPPIVKKKVAKKTGGKT